MDNRFQSCDSQRLLALMELEAGDADAAADQPPPAQSEAVPQIEGYRIIGRLGEGGMGTVWRAVQLRTRREVALKLLSSSSFGSERTRLRFDREVELTARLEHPHIARLYDSGCSGGCHFYAMELVDGIHLDEYVARQKLDRRQILQLLRIVCQAVNHAHQRGIIHRDLKPSNILVDRAGQPHIVDFGLARAVLEQADVAGEALTLDGQMAGTLAFMAPEQAAGQINRLDTRTDVYGLGATMYLLLVGQPAHDQRGPRYQVLKRIADDDVQPPRLLNRQIDVELEAMLLKALERNSDRRYGSAGELAQDISRYLNNEPMEAVPPSSLYKLRKFAGKHHMAMSVTAGVVLLLLTATAVSLWQAVRATRARQAALLAEQNALQAQLASDRQARRANAASNFMVNILSRARPVGSGHTMSVLDLLDGVSKQIRPTLRDQPEVEIQVRSALGIAYHQMGFNDVAASHLREALKLSRSLPGGANSELTLRLAAHVPVTPTLAPGDAAQAVRQAQDAHTTALTRFGPADPLTQQTAIGLAAALQQRADRVVGHEADLASAEDVLLPIVREPRVRYRTVHELCVVLIAERKFDKAASLATDALARAANDPTCLPLERAYLYADLVESLAAGEQLEKASQAAGIALDYDRRNLGAFHEVTQTQLRNFVDILRRSGQRPRASQLIEDDLHWARVIYPEDERAVADLLRKLGRIRMDDGDPSGIEIFAQAAEMHRRLAGPNNATARILAREVLLLRLGAHRQAADGTLGAQVFCALEDSLRDQITQLPEPGSVSTSATRYAVARWGPSGGGEIVASGNLDDLPKASDLQPGMYLLSLDLPVEGAQPLHQVMWILIANWRIEYYDGTGVGRFSPNSWPAIVKSGRVAGAAPSLAFSSVLRQRPTGSPAHFALTATTKLDLPAGRYRFAMTSDDGARLFVDGRRLVNSWSVHSVRRDFADVELDSGPHVLRVEYFEEGDRFNLWVTAEPRSEGASKIAASLGARPRRSVSTAIEQDTASHTPDAIAASAVLYALTGKYRQAVDAYETAIDLDATNPMWWQSRTLLSVALNDADGYRDWRGRMLRQLVPSDDRSVAARTVIAGSMENTAEPPPRALLDKLSVDAAPDSQRALCQLALGIVNYRSGRFEAAVASLKAAAAGRLTHEARAAAELFAAMSLRQLDRGAEARSLFDEASTSMASLPNPEQEELDATEAQDRLIAGLALREAVAVPAGSSPGK
jgi:tetratricopeptide (TPR) repeat protein